VKSDIYILEEGPGCEYEIAAARGTLQRMDSIAADRKANKPCNRDEMDVVSTVEYILHY